MDPLKPTGRPASGATEPAHRLVRWQWHVLVWSGSALLATGALWLALHYGAGADALPGPAETWSLRVHGLAAFAATFILGALAASHVPQGWRLSRRRGWTQQRRTGAWLCAMGAALVASGYALYYFAPETVRPVLGWSHAAIGVAMAALLLGHRRGV